ncbi:Transposable element P transposase [Frankliniella fusca]|uniref:Transposable element P transposase n=1 Tax=Frankliniella fusca TaxID=407009 RepID=A0AAE1I3A9_9NEOP|nr:Transposable element P transposase [Frankliniella fusca]
MSSDDLFDDSTGYDLSVGSSFTFSSESSSHNVSESSSSDEFSESLSFGSSFSLPSDCDVDGLFDTTSDEENDSDSNVADSELVHASPAVKKKVQRRKRGGFKRGFLFRKKGERSRSVSSESRGSGNMTDDYAEAVQLNLNSELSGDDVGSQSCASTLPSEGDKTVNESEEDEDESKVKDKKTTSKGKRRKKGIGIIKKYQWKKKSSDEAPTVEGEKVSDASTVEFHTTSDASTSVDLKDLFLASQEDNFMLSIKNYLSFTLDESWVVKCSDDSLCLCQITNIVNPVVERAITWNKCGKVNFLVHNQKLSAKSFLWTMKKADPENAGEVVDYLTTMCRRLSYFEICVGVQSHNHLWEQFSDNVWTDNYSSPPVLRSESCNILRVYPGRCNSCHKILKKFLDHERHKKLHQDGEIDITKINTRYLAKGELKQKIKRIQTEKKLSQQQVRRLKSRIKKLLANHSEEIDSIVSEDFVKILGENTNKMSAVEKLFWEQQSKALSKRDASKTMRWHPTMIRLALHLRMLSPAAYDFVKGFISLPSQRRLFDYSQFAEAKEGVQEEFLNQLGNLISEKCSADFEKYFSLLFDEMSIRSDLVYNARTGELVGFTNLSSLEEELASLEAEIQGNIHEKKLAKKVLVFMLTGAVNPIKFVAAVYSTDDLTAFQLYTRAWDVIYSVEEAGAKVLTAIFDGASVNRKFINMHVNAGSTNFVHVAENTAASESRPLYFMLDPPHILKTFRNCFANSNCHRNSRALCINNHELSWKAIQALFEIIQKKKYKDTKLSKAHVYLTSFSCMKVVLAVQVFSKSVANALRKYKDVSPLSDYYNEELVNFILKMNRWFDCFNASFDSKKKTENPDLLEYSSLTDPRFDFLKTEFLSYLQQWEEFVANRTGNYTKDQRSRMIISHQSLEAIRITVHSFIEVAKFLMGKGAPYVSARKFNQDPLEQYFSDQRRVRGADNNPTAKQVLHSRVAFHAVGQMTSGGKRGNTEDTRQMEVDSTPLPVRKKPKK